MQDNENQPALPELTDEQISALEEQRTQAETERLAPFVAAKQQRQENAAIVAEHDEAIADILYEITLNDLGLEA